MSNKKRFLTLAPWMIVLVIACAIPRLIRAEEQPSAGTVTDRSLFPKAYGLLANEHLMFPVDMSDWPVKIDDTRQLFVDDYLIAKSDNLVRQVHQVRKHPASPMLIPDKPWEKGGGREGCVFATIHRDAETGRFRIWYSGYCVYTQPSGQRARFPGLYAESEDGIRWHKPELGLYEFEGSKANNIIIPYGNLWGVFLDEKADDPDRRYMGLVWHEHIREGYYRYASPDGIHWKRLSDVPSALSSQKYTMPVNGIGDTSRLRWDAKLGKYVGDVKFVIPGKIRCRGIMFSDDLIHWTPPRMTIYPDGLDHADTQIYGHCSFCYESMWLGLMRVYHEQSAPTYKQTTIELTASRDGSHWTRVGRREEVIPFGGPDDWDGEYHAALTPIPVGDELWIYYRSAKMGEQKKQKQTHKIGLGILRRDGFVSLDAADTPGTVTTRPLSFSGKRLFINAEVADGGSITAALLSPSGEPVADYSPADAKPINTGGLKIPVTWKNATECRLPAGEHVRLKFELTKAKLYAFWIEQAEDGK